MKILLFGGTGAMGRNLSKILSEKGHDIYITSRSVYQDVGNIHYLKGNALDNVFVDKVLEEKYDVIVDFMLYNDNKYFGERINKLLNSTKHYIFLSSSRVYADSATELTETSPRLLEMSEDKTFIHNNDYPILKCRQEDILKNQKEKNYTIIRPYITYDNERLQLGIYEKEKWLYRAIKGRTIVFSKDMINKKTTLSNGYDVANQIASLIEKNKVNGDIYQITTTKSITWGEVLKIYVDVIKEKTGVDVNVKLLDSVYETKILKPNWQLEYDRGYNRIFDSSKILNLTGIKDGITPDYGLRKCLKEFLNNQKFRKIDWKDEALKDKICREAVNKNEIDNTKDRIIYILYRYTNIVKLENFLRKIKRIIKKF